MSGFSKCWYLVPNMSHFTFSCDLQTLVPGRPRTHAGTQVLERPAHGRAGGNPAPSRRESGPEPTEILSRPRSPPPLKYVPYSIPFGSDAAHTPLTPTKTTKRGPPSRLRYRPLGKIRRGNSETLGFCGGGFSKSGTHFNKIP